MVEHLPSGRRVLAPDLPGHGFSGWPDDRSRFTLPGMARGIRELMKALGAEPRLIAGHSAGAAVAVQADGRSVELTDALTLQRSARWVVDDEARRRHHLIHEELDALMAQPHADSPVYALDGQTLYFQSDRDGHPRLYARRLSDGAERSVAPGWTTPMAGMSAKARRCERKPSVA